MRTHRCGRSARRPRGAPGRTARTLLHTTECARACLRARVCVCVKRRTPIALAVDRSTNDRAGAPAGGVGLPPRVNQPLVCLAVCSTVCLFVCFVGWMSGRLSLRTFVFVFVCLDVCLFLCLVCGRMRVRSELVVSVAFVARAFVCLFACLRSFILRCLCVCMTSFAVRVLFPHRRPRSPR
jgi:hypothetical protein